MVRWIEQPPKQAQSLLASNSTTPVPRKDWPDFTKKMPSVIGVYAWQNPGIDIGTSEGTVKNVIGALEVLRETGESDPRFKADRWILVQTNDGKTRMGGPLKELPHKHHLMELPDWTVEYGSDQSNR